LKKVGVGNLSQAIANVVQLRPLESPSWMLAPTHLTHGPLQALIPSSDVSGGPQGLIKPAALERGKKHSIESSHPKANCHNARRIYQCAKGKLAQTPSQPTSEATLRPSCWRHHQLQAIATSYFGRCGKLDVINLGGFNCK